MTRTRTPVAMTNDIIFMNFSWLSSSDNSFLFRALYLAPKNMEPAKRIANSFKLHLGEACWLDL